MLLLAWGWGSEAVGPGAVTVPESAPRSASKIVVGQLAARRVSGTGIGARSRSEAL